MKRLIFGALLIASLPVNAAFALTTCQQKCRSYCGAYYPGDPSGQAACVDGCESNC